MTTARLPLFALMASLLAGCHCAKTPATPDTGTNSSGAGTAGVTSPSAIVYKTRTDVSDKVPVILSDDGSRIVSYPHPGDLKGASGLAVPTALEQGYLLDNRGINAHVAFLDITYEAYATLGEAPPMEKMMAMIIDKDPLLELCDCGPRKRFTDPKKEIDALIGSGKLRTTCKPIK